MDSYTEVFDAAEQARILGNNARAVELYAEADSLAKEFPSVDRVALHHMWGVALTSAGQYEEALTHLQSASRLADATRNSKTWVAIGRDLALLSLARERLSIALHEINDSLDYLPPGDLSRIAERGASIGVKARILLAQDRTALALELFGTADVLLQRSENRHYELYNLLHFMEAVIEHYDIYDGDDDARNFLQNQSKRLRKLAETYGGPRRREQAARIIADIFADVEG